MGTGIFITGTDTGVGKTAVAAGIAGALRNRGTAREVEGDLPGAIQDFEQFLQLLPDHPRAPEVRAWVKRLRNQVKARAAEDG